MLLLFSHDQKKAAADAAALYHSVKNIELLLRSVGSMQQVFCQLASRFAEEVLVQILDLYVIGRDTDIGKLVLVIKSLHTEFLIAVAELAVLYLGGDD